MLNAESGALKHKKQRQYYIFLINFDKSCKKRVLFWLLAQSHEHRLCSHPKTVAGSSQLLPSFCFLVWFCFYLLCSSDLCRCTFIRSLWQLTVGPVDGIRRDYSPGKSFSFQVRGDPGAKVSMVAVDNAVYLLKGDRLTQRKVCVFTDQTKRVFYWKETWCWMKQEQFIAKCRIWEMS